MESESIWLTKTRIPLWVRTMLGVGTMHRNNRVMRDIVQKENMKT